MIVSSYDFVYFKIFVINSKVEFVVDVVEVFVYISFGYYVGFVIVVENVEFWIFREEGLYVIVVYSKCIYIMIVFDILYFYGFVFVGVEDCIVGIIYEDCFDVVDMVN